MLGVLDIEEDDDLEVIEFIEFGIARQQRIRVNYFDDLDDVSFRRRFRLSRQCVFQLLPLIENELEYPHNLNNSISPINQLLLTLRLYATGGHLQSVADFGGVHMSTVCRIVQRVTHSIALLYGQVIKFPRDDKMRQTQQDFYNIASFPRVAGAIDCTHVKIQSPGGDEAEVYRNRKQYFSINVQAVCNSQLKFLNVVARWPGSAHDSTIFAHSNLCQEFENNSYENCLLIGDSGYPNKNYLVTPLLNPVTQAEQLYNESHIRTRNCIERSFGVLKRRFPILAYGCRLKINTVLGVIVAARVLHNIAIDMGDEEAPPIPEELDAHVLEQLILNGHIPDVVDHPQNQGDLMRQEIIRHYFSNIF